MEKNDKFDFMTKNLKVPGTSYSLKVGFLGDVWISQIFKANKIMASKNYDKIEGEFPNQNEIVNWVLQTIPIPNLNPHKIMKTIQTLAKEAIKQKKHFDLENKKVSKENLQKSEEIAQKQIKRYNEKLNFLRTIKNKIETKATGNEILQEYNNYPRHFAGILRMYDSTLKKIGDKRIIDYILKERKKSKKFSRIDSMDSFLDLLKNEQKSVEKQLQQLVKD